MWITRDVEPKLQRSARTRPVVVLKGARQTGKTSTLLRLFPSHSFVSLDLPTEAEQAEKEPQNFLRRHPSPTIIDEVQYAPGLFRHLKVSVDASRMRNGQFLLTGSQKFTLMNSVSESLAGGTLLLIASDIPTDAELTEIKSFWMWEPVRERWQYVCDWEEHKREAMRSSSGGAPPWSKQRRHYVR